MATTNLKSLSVPELLAMRSEIDEVLQSKKSELRAQLAEIGGEEYGRGSRMKGRKVDAKYRHPKTGETWSGRGGVAKWLADELKSGRKREDFLIDKASAAPKATRGKGRPKKA